MLLQKIKRVTWALIVVVCVLGAVEIMLMIRPLQLNPELPESTLLAPAQLNMASSPSDVTVVSGRPLFWSERRPYVKPVQSKPKPKPEKLPVNNALDDVELVGVIAAGRSSSVIIKAKEDKGDVQRVLLDDLYQGWRLIDVTSTSAVFALENAEAPEQPRVREVRINHREPLPQVWQGSENNLSESQ